MSDSDAKILSAVEHDGLGGKMLIAMPGMGDERFEKTVIYMCAHSADGAIGLVVNRRAAQISRGDLFNQLDIEANATDGENHIYFGGPVETGRGFVLHSADYHVEDATLEVDEEVSMTATLDILQSIAAGEGPRQTLIALGYSGWSEGQLEQEVRNNGWLVCDADEAIIFGSDDTRKWEAALAKLGIDPMLLSADGGSA